MTNWVDTFRSEPTFLRFPFLFRRHLAQRMVKKRPSLPPLLNFFPAIPPSLTHLHLGDFAFRVASVGVGRVSAPVPHAQATAPAAGR